MQISWLKHIPWLTHTPWFGWDRLWAVEWAVDKGPRRWMLLSRQKGEIKALDWGELADEKALQEVRAQAPHLPVLLSLVSARLVVSVLPAETIDPLPAIMGTRVENFEDFLLQKEAWPNGQASYSLSRASVLTDWQAAQPELATQLVGINLSPVTACHLLPAWEAYEAEALYDVEGPNLTWQNGLQAGAIPSEAHPLGVDWATLAETLEIPEAFLPLFGSGVGFWLGQGLETAETAQQKPRFRHMQLISRGLAAGLALMLLLGLVLGGLRGYCQHQAGAVSRQLVAQEANMQKLRSQAQEVSTLRRYAFQLSQRSGMGSRASYFVDRLAAEMPYELSWNRMLIGPTPAQWKKIPGTEGVPLASICIIGRSRGTQWLAEYVARLQAWEEVSEARMLHNQYDFSSDRYHFVIALYLPGQKAGS